MNEYYAVVRSTDELAHYGVKGMKWGVRKALANRNERALDRHFRKAAKKLAKLQDIGTISKKYAAKAAAYGAAAAGTGTIAIAGTKGISSALIRSAKRLALKAENAQALMKDAKNPQSLSFYGTKEKADKAAKRYENESVKYDKAAKRKTELSGKVDKWGDERRVIKEKVAHNINGQTQVIERTRHVGLTNNEKLRIGAAAATIGLAGKAAQNAYRATHGAQYRQKAHDFKMAMDNVFSGTKYAGQYVAPPRSRKRRKSGRR
ncbi:MAG: hypothetical protein ILP14_06375 [Oscillospiraceae bacterium]|nr:hypothetical protein [Oscillospiraceae bacterium]